MLSINTNSASQTVKVLKSLPDFLTISHIQELGDALWQNHFKQCILNKPKYHILNTKTVSRKIVNGAENCE